jgi:hypothetical protein
MCHVVISLWEIRFISRYLILTLFFSPFASSLALSPLTPLPGSIRNPLAPLPNYQRQGLTYSLLHTQRRRYGWRASKAKARGEKVRAYEPWQGKGSRVQGNYKVIYELSANGEVLFCSINA